MRTVLFIGLLEIANAIDKTAITDAAAKILGPILFVVAVMDMYDFFRDKGGAR